MTLRETHLKSRRLLFETCEPRELMANNLDYITAEEAQILLQRAAAASSTEDAIIAVVDRNGTILGVRTEGKVALNLKHDLVDRVFAIDGAVAKARTAAFFSSDQAPLTSRTVRNLSQSTITQREVESSPNYRDGDPLPFDTSNSGASSRTFGPGFVAPIGVGGHFPPGVANTPPVDLFGIERQGREGLVNPGPDGVKGTPPDPTKKDDITLAGRFNVAPADGPGLAAIGTPQSYGEQSGLFTNAQSRGFATLPGGIPLYKEVVLNGKVRNLLVGGIGVFFPGEKGYATFEQGFKAGVGQSEKDRLNAPRAIEAEFIALAAAGGSKTTRVGELGVGVKAPALPQFFIPFTDNARIDLVGIKLEIVGPNPDQYNRETGLQRVLRMGRDVGPGAANSGVDRPVKPGGVLYQNGKSVRVGWLVPPRDGNGFTAAEVEQMIDQGIAEAKLTRAAIRLTDRELPGTEARMVLAVADRDGKVLGLYRMADATVFSIDVAVAKARNTAYYANSDQLQPADMVDDDQLLARRKDYTVDLIMASGGRVDGVKGIPDLYASAASNAKVANSTGLAFTNRTFRYLALPRFPSSVDGTLPPVFSILNEANINRFTAENVHAPSPAWVFNSVMGFDSFHIARNFRNPHNPANQNGIVFFPGSSALYKGRVLKGGLGVSGDGVDQDDVVTVAAQGIYAAPFDLRADQAFYRDVRLPYQKFNRNPRPGA